MIYLLAEQLTRGCSDKERGREITLSFIYRGAAFEVA